MYPREELERFSYAFQYAQLRTCLTPSGKEVFVRGLESVEKILRGDYTSSDVQNVKEADELLKDIHSDRTRSRARGLIKEEEKIRVIPYSREHEGHGGHGGH